MTYANTDDIVNAYRDALMQKHNNDRAYVMGEFMAMLKILIATGDTNRIVNFMQDTVKEVNTLKEIEHYDETPLGEVIDGSY